MSKIAMTVVRFKLLFIVLATAAFGMLLTPLMVSAEDADPGTAAATLECDDATDPFCLNKARPSKLGNKDLMETVTQIINVALGLLGIVAVVIILIGGFKWMTAGGSEDKVSEARKLIFSGIIGIAIILSAWAIASFVLNNLQDATGAGTASDFTG